MNVPNILVVDPVKGYTLVNKSKYSTLAQLYSLMECTTVEMLLVNKDFDDPDAEIYCDEEGLLRNSAPNPFIIPFIDNKQAEYLCQFGGPRGICVIMSPNLSQRNLLKLFSEDKFGKDADDYAANMIEAIRKYNS